MYSTTFTVAVVLLTYAEKARQSNSTILIHCMAGISRSVTVTIAYLMQHFGMCMQVCDTCLLINCTWLEWSLILCEPFMHKIYIVHWERHEVCIQLAVIITTCRTTHVAEYKSSCCF